MSLDSKLTRRELFAATASAAVLPRSDLSAPSLRYAPVPGWGKTSDRLGWGVGIECDAKDRVYVHSRLDKAVIVFDRHGRRLYDFGSEFAATGHGLTWHKDGRAEFLYFCDHGRNLVVKTDLSGKTLMRIGETARESANSIRFSLNQPTDLAVSPDGRLFVAEGYGGNRIQVFNAAGRHLYSIGGPGSAPGKFSCPHGIWIDTRKREPELYVADRSNQRIQVLTLEGRFRRSVDGIIRLPNGFYEHADRMYVPDLDGRVTVLDRHDRLLTHLDNAPGPISGDPAKFIAPHAVCLDSRGDLYVIEWVEGARIQKFRQA